MQKLIETQFFCYPKNKDLCILYRDVQVLDSRLFKALSLQISPKEGFLLRLRKTRIGHFLSSFSASSKMKVKITEGNSIKLGYKNQGKIIYFTLDDFNNPTSIIKESSNNIFQNTPFLGYSIIEEYSKKEYFKKREFIKLALLNRWNEVENNNILHGDFTHFNVLLSVENKLSFIDEKQVENSKLFDHFYFYSYYIQCLEKCETISNTDVNEIKVDLQKMLSDIFKGADIKAIINQIDVEDAIGINDKETKFNEFSNFLLKNER
jgi:hypothetical protein